MRLHGVDLTQELPGYANLTRRLRSSESAATARTMMIAATLCLIRGSALPWWLRYFPGHGRAIDTDVMYTSLLLMAVFLFCYVLSKINALFGALTAIVLVLATVSYSYSQNHVFESHASVFYAIIAILLLRGLMSAILSKTV